MSDFDELLAALFTGLVGLAVVVGIIVAVSALSVTAGYFVLQWLIEGFGG